MSDKPIYGTMIATRAYGIISIVEMNEKLDSIEQLKKQLAEAVEVITWYSMPSINHHNYHSAMGTNLTTRAEQFLAKYRGEK